MLLVFFNSDWLLLCYNLFFWFYFVCIIMNGSFIVFSVLIWLLLIDYDEYGYEEDDYYNDFYFYGYLYDFNDDNI